jgi:hypothetical protein
LRSSNRADPDTHSDDLEDWRFETAHEYATECVAATRGLAGIDHEAAAGLWFRLRAPLAQNAVPIRRAAPVQKAGWAFGQVSS